MSENWNKAELLASVSAYMEMQQKHRAGIPFTKKQYYESLASEFGRSAKAFEYRMQNISYVLSQMGREWLPGLKPARNVGANVAVEIEALINRLGKRKAPPVVGFELAVKEAAKTVGLSPPRGYERPKSTPTNITQYQRDPAVKAWVLREAGGRCECCREGAPFEGVDGAPFLEIHHVRQLADGGSDKVSNAVALCPNCHRELHYGARATELVESLYRDIQRLVRE